jgi:hypothetical protein
VEGSTVLHSWDSGAGNVAGTQRFRVQVRTCDPTVVVAAEGSLFVTPIEVGDPPPIQSFTIPTDQLDVFGGPGTTKPCYWDAGPRYWVCDATVTFEVCTFDEGTDPDSFRVDFDGTFAQGETTVTPVAKPTSSCAAGEKGWTVTPSYTTDIGPPEFRPTIRSFLGGDPNPQGAVALDYDIVTDP